MYNYDMKLLFRFKHHFFNAFREIFIHHHGSLEFRAKLFALMIAVNDKIKVENFIIVRNYGLKIYKSDEQRADLLMLTTKEMVNKIEENNGLDIDTLIYNIQRLLKQIPRYAKKIDIESLKPIMELTYDEDTLSYQKNILEFLETLKHETLKDKKEQIELDEKNLN